MTTLTCSRRAATAADHEGGPVPIGMSWMRTLAYGYHEDRTPTRGYEATWEAAVATFGKSVRRK
jgi:hypothetical protein